jgi:hypothetical protein
MAIFSQRFSITNNNNIEFILGKQIWHNPRFILTLFQDKYTFGVLHKFTMTTYFYISWSTNLVFSPTSLSLVASIPYAYFNWAHLILELWEMLKNPYFWK